MLKKILIISVILALILVIYFFRVFQKPIDIPAQPGLPVYTAADLQNYNGEDPTKTILLALDGLVYDVTPGKEFYQAGGDYHYLAGKDSSIELHIAGGDIIKRKYKVIGTCKI
jgi:predicted heme/steroid binding protein